MIHAFVRQWRVVPLVSLGFALLIASDVSIRGESRSSQSQPQQQSPVFRAGVNLVTVDTYPIRDGRIVEGLTADDFEVLEDGKPQKVDAFEFVRVEPTPTTALRDPNTVGESLKLAADPHNRVFVVYLDTHFVKLDSSRYIRLPLVQMLDGVLMASDLFGVMTPRMRAQDMAMARKTETIETELAKFWPWALRDNLKAPPEGELAVRCYENPAMNAQGSEVFDYGPITDIPPEILQRSYEDLTLTRLEELIAFLGRVREARSSAVVVTDGWMLYRRNEPLATQVGNLADAGRRPGIFIGPGGKLGSGGSRDPSAMGGRDMASCSSEMVRLARMDDQQRMRDLIAAANRSNVTFYAVNPSGLSAFDQSPDMMTPRQTQALTQNTPGNNLAGVLMSNMLNRINTLLALTKNTDGIAIVNTNDLTDGIKRIVDENAAYYLLGYYSTNTKLDGTYRQIQVRMKDPKVRVTARRGYTAGREGDRVSAALRPTSGGAAPAIMEAIAGLDRIKPDAELIVSAAAGASELTVVAEIALRQFDLTKWTDGADVQVIATDASGQALAGANGRILPGTRGAAVKIPIEPSARGPWTVRAVVTGSVGTIEDRALVQRPAGAVLGAPVMFRGTPSARSMLVPVADGRFRRTERVHVEWPVLRVLDQREARLLGRDGQPLAVAVTVTERESDGHPILTADCVLGPVADGDYVIEVSAGSGGQTERQLVALRVFR